MSGHAPRKFHVYDETARVARALANGKRLELLDLLGQAERTVEGVARTADLGTALASAHLKTLRQGGLVAVRRDGARAYHRLAGDDVADLYLRLRTVAVAHLADAAAAVAEYLTPEATPLPHPDVSRRARAGELLLLDVRPEAEYRAGHVPGASSLPLELLPDRLDEFPVAREIVAYGRDAFCGLAPEAVRILADHRHTARRMDIGMLEWRLARLPVERPD
ncbi:metalloregulator ArsR/SmtB family transcription factor [Micromonospora sp. NPDC050495]|uniref:ArsR/SmtB family transcription factor n=1 Tax=Micromonospora sp. NPDC050495 TaxID=3154936 RepID=UPI0033FF0936